MFLYWYVNLQEGDLCIVTKDQHPYYGRMISFKEMDCVMQNPLFIFETTDKEKVILHSEFEFTTLPYKESIRFLIDLAMRTRDEEWFRELIDQLHHRSQ